MMPSFVVVADNQPPTLGISERADVEEKRLQRMEAHQKLAATERGERLQAEAGETRANGSGSERETRVGRRLLLLLRRKGRRKRRRRRRRRRWRPPPKPRLLLPPTTHVKVHSHAAPKASEIEEADEFESFNPLDLFAALEGTKKTPFEKQTTASGEVVENAVLNKKDKLSSVFATMLGSMMEVSRGVG